VSKKSELALAIRYALSR
jgi:transposase